jgi:taurine--2-oxoglutarate transaminase
VTFAADREVACFEETVLGTNIILMPPDGYLGGVRQLCDDKGILYIADEVMAGYGRTGQWSPWTIGGGPRSDPSPRA